MWKWKGITLSLSLQISTLPDYLLCFFNKQTLTNVKVILTTVIHWRPVITLLALLLALVTWDTLATASHVVVGIPVAMFGRVYVRRRNNHCGYRLGISAPGQVLGWKLVLEEFLFKRAEELAEKAENSRTLNLLGLPEKTFYPWLLQKR